MTLHEDRGRELDMQRATNEENILEEGHDLTNFTNVKQQNVHGIFI